MSRLWLCLLSLLCVSAISPPAQTSPDNTTKPPAKDSSTQTKAKKVYTNDDISGDKSTASSDDAQSSPSGEKPGPSGSRTADQWKAIIGRQKAVVASQQAQIDELEKSIHYVDASQYSEGAAYNAAQKKKQDRVAVMKQKLAVEKQTLADLQEQARKSGFGSSVDDP